MNTGSSLNQDYRASQLRPINQQAPQYYAPRNNVVPQYYFQKILDLRQCHYSAPQQYYQQLEKEHEMEKARERSANVAEESYD